MIRTGVSSSRRDEYDSKDIVQFLDNTTEDNFAHDKC